MALRYALRLALAAVVLSGTAAAQHRTLTDAPDADAPKRVALVLGNSEYTDLPLHRTASDDAEDMAAALNEVGFMVFSGTDLTAQETERALRDFAGALTGAEVAFVFYAGHGAEVDGVNYLLPIDLGRETEPFALRHEALSFDRVLEALDRGQVPLKVAVLDGHRGNPLSWGSRSRDPAQAPPAAAEKMAAEGEASGGPTGSGWAPSMGATGTIVAFGSAPGAVVVDSPDSPDSRNGLLTAALLDHLTTPGVEVSRAFRLAAQRVYQESDGEQQPFLSLGYLGDFYMVPEPSR